MDLITMLIILIPVVMEAAWLTVIAVYYNWDFKEWFHESDNDR